MILVFNADGIIVNIVREGSAEPPPGGRAVELTAPQEAEYLRLQGRCSSSDIRMVGDVFVPQIATSGSFMEALIDLGFYDQVKAVVDASNAVTIKVLWDRAVTFDRRDPRLMELGAAANLTPTDMDNVFLKASTY